MDVLVAEVLRNAGEDAVRNLSLVIVYQEDEIAVGEFQPGVPKFSAGRFLLYLLRLCKSYLLWN